MAETSKPIKKRASTQVFLDLVGVVLIVLSLFLSPFSIGKRLFHTDYPTIGQEGGIVTEPGGAALSVAEGSLEDNLKLRMQAVLPNQQVEDEQSLQMASLPQGLQPVSPFYHFDMHGSQPLQSILVIPTLQGVNHNQVDLYTWQDGGWQWTACDVLAQDGRVEAVLESIPQMAVLAQNTTRSAHIAANLLPFAQPQPKELVVLSELNPDSAFLRDDGTVGCAGDMTKLADDGTMIVPMLSNRVNGVVRSDWVDNMLIETDAINEHVSKIAAWADLYDYQGVLIDYANVDPALRDDFSAFVEALAARLHAQDTILEVQVATPIQIAEDQWQTGAYDWQRIGAAADMVRIPALTEPVAYTQGGQMESLLQWATRQVERSKLALQISAYSRQIASDRIDQVTYANALAQIGAISVDGLSDTVPAGAPLEVRLANLLDESGLLYDEASGSHWFTYANENGETHEIWLENASSIARKLDLVSTYQLGGVAVNNLLGEQSDTQIWNVLAAWGQQSDEAPAHGELEIVYSMASAEGESLMETVKPLNGAKTVLQAPEQPGRYFLAAAVAAVNSDSTPVSGGQVEFVVPSPTATSTDTPTNTPTNTPTFTPTDTPTETPIPATYTPTFTPTPDADAYVDNARLNLRAGPSERHKILGTYSQGDLLTVFSQIESGDWVEVEAPDGTRGWMYAGYIHFNIDKASIPVNAAPPTPPPAPQVVSYASGASQFGYGIQAAMVTDGNHGRILSHVQQMGFGWVKQQVEWFRYNPAPGQYDWGALDRIVDSSNAAGINVMFSVVKAPGWARPPGDTDEGPPADPNTYGTFMRELAARYKGRVKAYEIWNEQNLYYEWGGRGGKLNAGQYVQLLRVAYQAVKSVDPNAVVISGALTPTGVNDGDIAIDDRAYLEQMYQAGLKNYCDAVGAHPSGYNNPPDADWRNWSDPTAGFRATGHPSWFFRGTMESYRNIMVAYGDAAKKIWVTEFGWASVHNLGVPPARGYEYAADNTEEEQAQYIVRAYEMGKNWGFVGVMFLWNMNFGPVAGAGDEKAAFGIVRPDWSPRPAFAALAHMPK